MQSVRASSLKWFPPWRPCAATGIGSQMRLSPKPGNWLASETGQRRRITMPHRIPRSAYADIYGPTTGDKVRLGDTSLTLEVEKDFCVYGDECKFGGGKVLREGMGQAAGVDD